MNHPTQAIKNIPIKLLDVSDIRMIVTAFQKVSWEKSASLFEAYYQEQQQAERVVWLAYYETQFAGYITP